MSQGLYDLFGKRIFIFYKHVFEKRATKVTYIIIYFTIFIYLTRFVMSQLKQMLVDFEYNGSKIKLILSKLLIDNCVPCEVHDILNNRIMIFVKEGFEETIKWKKCSFLYHQYLYHNVINKKPTCFGNF